MKRSLISLFFAFFMAFSMISCTDYQSQIEALQKQINELSELSRQSGANVSALEKTVNAIKSGNPVESVTPVKKDDEVTGYILKFKDGGEVTVYNQSYNITVCSDNGRYYWKADGEWLKDSKGNRIEVGGEEAPAPQFKIEDSVLKISVDGGKSWSVTSAKFDKPLVASVEDTQSAVLITLSDGSVISIPRSEEVSVTFNTTPVTAYDEETVETTYTISGATPGMKVRVIGNNGWEASLVSEGETNGTVRVTAPAGATDTDIILSASDNEGRTFFAGIHCTAAGPMPELPTAALENTQSNIAALQTIEAAVNSGNGIVSAMRKAGEKESDAYELTFEDESIVSLLNFSAAISEEMMAGAPQAKIEGFLLMVSADGQTWQEGCTDEDFVKSVADSEEAITLTLAGGWSLVIPKTLPEPEKPKFEIFAYASIPTPYASHDNFVKMAEAGFTISHSNFTKDAREGRTVLENVIKALDAAEGTGVKLCIPITEWVDPYTSSILKPEKTLEEVIAAIKDHPALWGYLIGDEPSADELTAYGSYIETYQKLDPNHPWYTCFLPVSTYTNTSTHAEYVEAVTNHFLKYPTQFLAFDMYPVRTGNSVASWWYEALENYSGYTRKNNIPLAGMACSVEFDGQAYPSVEALRLQNYTNLAYGCQALMYFTYMVPYYVTDGWVNGSAPMKLDGTLSEVYDMVKQVNAELNNQAFVFLGSKVKWIRNTTMVPSGTTRLSTEDYYSVGFDYFKANKHAVLSLLENEGCRYLVIVNQSLQAANRLTIELDKNGKKAKIVNKDGTLTPITDFITNEEDTYMLPEGDALILKLD